MIGPWIEMRRFDIPPPTARQARWAIFLPVLFGPLWYMLLPFVITILGACRAWSNQPRWFWRLFTILSLLVAASGALGWPLLGRSWLKLVFGPGRISISPLWQNVPYLLGWWAASYVVWSALLLPHMVARLLYAKHERATGN